VLNFDYEAPQFTVRKIQDIFHNRRILAVAFPYDSKPKYTIRDRDKIYGKVFIDRMKAMDIDEVLIAPRSPWHKENMCQFRKESNHD
jgi:hypothetical protein